MDSPRKSTGQFIEIWRGLDVYGRFEQIVAIFLSVLISVVIVFSCLRLGVKIFELIVFKDDLMDPAVFTAIFAMVLTVLIALEFNHSIVQVVERKQSIVQVRIVVQIAILAIVRKFVLLDLTNTPPLTLLGLAAIVVAIAGLYFVVRQSDHRRNETTQPSK